MKRIYILLITAVTFLSSCSKEPNLVEDPFVVAFKHKSGKLLSVTSEGKKINLVYSEPAKVSGSIKIKITTKNANYGSDFITVPQAINNEITLPVLQGKTENSFELKELNNAFTDVMQITFTIVEIAIENSNIQGNTSAIFNDAPFLGGSFEPLVGGANQPNQVYIDLSSNKETVAKRDTWDLGFYSGKQFRVVINGSLYMATKALNTTDINSVTSASVSRLKSEVAVGTFKGSNANYIDAPNGNILETAIDELSNNNATSKVYLLNLGYKVSTSKPNTGSVAIAGDFRGWKKIRILKHKNGYKLQYANLDNTSYKEVLISKKTPYNFTFFSFNKEKEVMVEPPKNQWDICFTVFTNVLGKNGSYGFSDYVTHNRKGKVTAYKLKNYKISYNNFSKEHINESLLKENQKIIGSSWRNVFSKSVFNNVFYVLKDSDNNFYKIKFLALLNKKGERGYPKFEYKRLN